MRAPALASCLVTLLAAGCGCAGLLDAVGNLEPDALDADDSGDLQVDVEAVDTPADTFDAHDGDDPDVGDPPVDPPEEEAGCVSDDECSDLEPCNGAETCGEDGECHDGTPLEDGTPCVSPTGLDGICNGEVCRPPGCGDGIPTGTEECDDGNTLSGDGCENDCTFTCHADGECDDSDVCTDDACISGGTGQVCDNSFNTAPCDDSNPCSHTDTCDGAGTCIGTGYACTLEECQASSECDGTGGCTITYSSSGTPCTDLDPCTHTDVCDGAGACDGTTYACTPGPCEDSSSCDGLGGCVSTPSPSTRTCDDSDPCTHTDHCDGAGTCIGTSYACVLGVCEASSVCDGAGGCTVTISGPGDPCDDSDPCTHTDVCDSGGGCAGTAYSCTPGMCESASACDGTGGCTPTYSPPTTPCNDSDICTHTDRCNGSGGCAGTGYACALGVCEVFSECDGLGGCTVTYAGSGAPCDDSDPCTHTDVCDVSHACSGTSYTCTPGVCEATSVCDGTGGCTITPAAPGTPCTDPYSCTSGETCDSSGDCTGGIEDDTACGPGEVCRPACFPSTGCGLPPSSLDVSCPGVTVLTSDATCTITLDTMTGQVVCLDCTTEIGTVTLSSDSFEGPGGSCDMGGWSLVTGDNCRDRVDEGGPCTPGGATRTCCSNASTIAYDMSGDCVLRTDRNTNCGGSGDSREWRIIRDYDTAGITDLEICLNIADWQAMGNDGILVYAIDPTHNEQIFCQMGPPVSGGTGVDWFEWPYCANLPTWAEDNPDLQILVVAHSHDDNDALFLDDVVVRGWSSSCTPSRTSVFSEDFEPCPVTSPIPSGWNGWTITGTGGPNCTDVCSGGSPGGAEVNNGQWSMTHDVDTSSVDSDVRLCFEVGDDGSDWNEWIRVSFDTGAGWWDAWYWENEWGTDGSCRRVCVNLSDIDPRAARNPDLAIRFTLNSNQSGEIVHIDDIEVDGAVHCDGTGSVSTGTISDLGGGTYSFDLSDDAGTPMGAWAECTWDTPPVPVLGFDGTWFQSP